MKIFVGDLQINAKKTHKCANTLDKKFVCLAGFLCKCHRVAFKTSQLE